MKVAINSSSLIITNSSVMFSSVQYKNDNRVFKGPITWTGLARFAGPYRAEIDVAIT